ncbi:hypothetical protein [Streptomyces sp. NPDC059894]|uniref:hypothetical protein n=1 Tax=unclassified Streptomyces TaxID=2593676 RepID=UPI003657B51C
MPTTPATSADPEAGPGTRAPGGAAGTVGRARHDASRGDGRGPAPLPVRGAHEERPNPAEAVPGIRPGDRPVVEGYAGQAPLPRVGAVRGTMGKPRLPRRRAQEHIVPQLRGGPAPRQDTDRPVGHDPGLMAAFQRGIGLAEAQQSLEAEASRAAAAGPAELLAPPPPPPPAAEGRTEPAPALGEAYGADGHDHHPTTRHDGSTPAG